MCNAFAQTQMNAYKHVIVPSQFEFQKTANQHGINMLLKYKFQQLGFETYLDSEVIPKELKTNTCFYLTPKLKHKSTAFYTKISVEISNCDGKILFTTQEGKSNSKSYKISNNVALRQALESFKDYRLNYQPIHKEEVVISNKQAPLEESNQVADTKFLYNTEFVSFVNDNELFYAEIKNNKSSKIIGTLSQSSKRGVFHVQLESKKGLGYYDETGSFIVEFVADNGQVILQKFQLLN